MRLVSPSFHLAAQYLLTETTRFHPATEPILVEDTDVGPMLVDAADTGVGQWIREEKTWEPSEGQFLRSVLHSGMNAIDVGAHIGYFTLLMARAVAATGNVLAIEAEPENFRLLRANVERSGLTNVDMLPVAAHRAPGLMSVTRNASNQGGSHICGPGWEAHAWPVQAVRLDDVLDPEVAIDVVKIDVEGLDHAVVQGLERTVRRWRPVVLAELNPVATELHGESVLETLRLYRDLGLEIRLLGSDALLLQTEGDTQVGENSVVLQARDAELIERTREAGWVNLILTGVP